MSNGSLLPFMNFLEAPDPNGIAPACSNRLHGGLRSAQSRDARHPIRHRRSPNRFLIAKGMRAGGGVNNQLQRSRFQQINSVRTTLVELENRLALQSGGLERSGGAASRHDLEAKLGEAAGHLN